MPSSLTNFRKLHTMKFDVTNFLSQLYIGPYYFKLDVFKLKYLKLYRLT